MERRSFPFVLLATLAALCCFLGALHVMQDAPLCESYAMIGVQKFRVCLTPRLSTSACRYVGIGIGIADEPFEVPFAETFPNCGVMLIDHTKRPFEILHASHPRRPNLRFRPCYLEPAEGKHEVGGCKFEDLIDDDLVDILKLGYGNPPWNLLNSSLASVIGDVARPKQIIFEMKRTIDYTPTVKVFREAGYVLWRARHPKREGLNPLTTVLYFLLPNRRWA
jgi:hypothetical protein